MRNYVTCRKIAAFCTETQETGRKKSVATRRSSDGTSRMKANRVRTVPPDKGLSRGLRRYLYFTAVVTGAAIMIIEILARRCWRRISARHTSSGRRKSRSRSWPWRQGITPAAGWRIARPKLNRLYGAVLLAAFYSAPRSWSSSPYPFPAWTSIWRSARCWLRRSCFSCRWHYWPWSGRSLCVCSPHRSAR